VQAVSREVFSEEEMNPVPACILPICDRSNPKVTMALEANEIEESVASKSLS
jgi:hypothetical protein